MRRNQSEQKTEKANQVCVIDVNCLFEKEEVGMAQAEQNGAQTVGETNRHEKSENPGSDPMHVEPLPRPGMDPGESVIFEEQPWLQPVGRNVSPDEVNAVVPDEEDTKDNPKEDDRPDIDRRKSAGLESFDVIS